MNLESIAVISLMRKRHKNEIRLLLSVILRKADRVVPEHQPVTKVSLAI
jgi:hypothetical protein